MSVGLVLGATLHGGRIVSERVRRAEDYRRYSVRPAGTLLAGLYVLAIDVAQGEFRYLQVPLYIVLLVT